jgi:hypothetical protein
MIATAENAVRRATDPRQHPSSTGHPTMPATTWLRQLVCARSAEHRADVAGRAQHVSRRTARHRRLPARSVTPCPGERRIEGQRGERLTREADRPPRRDGQSACRPSRTSRSRTPIPYCNADSAFRWMVERVGVLSSRTLLRPMDRQTLSTFYRDVLSRHAWSRRLPRVRRPGRSRNRVLPRRWPSGSLRYRRRGDLSVEITRPPVREPWACSRCGSLTQMACPPRWSRWQSNTRYVAKPGERPRPPAPGTTDTATALMHGPQMVPSDPGSAMTSTCSVWQTSSRSGSAVASGRPVARAISVAMQSAMLIGQRLRW